MNGELVLGEKLVLGKKLQTMRGNEDIRWE